MRRSKLLYALKKVFHSCWVIGLNRGEYAGDGGCFQESNDKQLSLRLILDDPLGGEEDLKSELPAWYNLDPTSTLRIRCESPARDPYAGYLCLFISLFGEAHLLLDAQMAMLTMSSGNRYRLKT